MPPQIDNPAYKGPWKARQVRILGLLLVLTAPVVRFPDLELLVLLCVHFDFSFVFIRLLTWRSRVLDQIANPDYFEDSEPHKMQPMVSNLRRTK